MSIWTGLISLLGLSIKLKQELELPDYVLKISGATADYEKKIADLWAEFKQDPNDDTAKVFIEKLQEIADNDWEQLFLNLLDQIDLNRKQRKFLEKELNDNKKYMVNSLYPDLIKELAKGNTAFNNLDYRVIALYAGALWSFGFLSTVMWDGLEARDLADVFLFIGPKDEATCTGERGCEQHVGKFYTVAQILKDQIIPGKLKCLTNCRHMLLPIASPINT